MPIRFYTLNIMCPGCKTLVKALNFSVDGKNKSLLFTVCCGSWHLVEDPYKYVFLTGYEFKVEEPVSEIIDFLWDGDWYTEKSCMAEELTCPDCDFYAATERGLAIHRARMHKKRTTRYCYNCKEESPLTEYGMCAICSRDHVNGR